MIPSLREVNSVEYPRSMSEVTSNATVMESQTSTLKRVDDFTRISSSGVTAALALAALSVGVDFVLH